MVVFLRGEDRHFIRRRNVTERELHREPVHLRLRQRIGAAKFHRVFRGDDKKQIRQIPPLALDAHLGFAHRFEQRRLRARRGAVDFVGEQNVREHRAFVKMKFLILLVENGNSENVRRQQIRRELDALEFRVNGLRQRLGERGFAGAGIIFEQNVSARRKRGQQMPRGARLATHDLGDVVGNFPVSFARGGEIGWSRRGHFRLRD